MPVTRRHDITGAPLEVEFTVYGQVASLKNRKQQVYVTNRKTGNRESRLLPNEKAVQFADDFGKQVPREVRVGFVGVFEVETRVWYPSWRSDHDMELVYDLLQSYGVIENDRYIIRKVSERQPNSKRHPRVWIRVALIGPRPVKATKKAK